MDHFQYIDGVLHCEEVAVPSLAEEFGTPLYVYSSRTLTDHYRRIHEAFSPLRAEICFSIKSCQNLSILRLLKDGGAAFDVVSGGEIARALEAGADAERIVFAGVGKSEAEIRYALDSGVGWFNVESESELDTIATIAESRNQTARCALRVNPDVDPHTHIYTTTGKRETKFGVDLERARRVFRDFSGRRGLDLCGIHLHIGSPVNTIEPYVKSITKGLALIDELCREGFPITAINLGGGYGAHYDGAEAPSASAYAERIVPLLSDRGLGVLIEPGRSIAANAGILLTKTHYTKSSGDKQFIIVDAAINDLLRPALYGSFHFAWPAVPHGGIVATARTAGAKPEGTTLVDIVGPVCESSDYLAKDRYLPPVQRGDLIAVFSAGAYGFSMSSQYNSRPRAAEVLVSGRDATLIRRRETYDDLVAAERL